MKLPDRIFFTGVPGSRWSGISQTIENMVGMNTSDRTPDREYMHHSYTGHKGAYFGTGMEFEPILDCDYIDQAWKIPGGCKIIKSHEWSYYLSEINEKFPNDWIMMVYRPDNISYSWWCEVGGFEIQYPNYDFYGDHQKMMLEINRQNSEILKYGFEKKCKWEYFTEDWIYKNFGQRVAVSAKHVDILVTIIK